MTRYTRRAQVQKAACGKSWAWPGGMLEARLQTPDPKSGQRWPGRPSVFCTPGMAPGVLDLDPMSGMLQEVRYAVRGFRKSPLLVVAAIVSLALGIGANTAIFSLTDQVLLRSLPAHDPGRLVLFSAKGPKSGMVQSSYDDNYAFSYPLYCDFRDRAPGLAGVMARFPMRLSVTAGDRTEIAQAELVSGNYFNVLGVGAALGRPLMPEDDRIGGLNDVVVLSYGLWKSRFGSSQSILNQRVRINGQPMTVVGVAQAGFKGAGAGESTDVFVPIALQPRLFLEFDGLTERRAYWLNIIARLAPGVSPAQAESAANVFWKPILEKEALDTPTASAKYRREYAGRHLELQPGGRGISSVREQATGPLMVLTAMAGVLLLIACANIASLLIARAAGRRKEIAIRLAVGAGRRRLLRQLLIEGIALSLAGGLMGVFTAEWSGDLLLGFLPSDPSMLGITSQPDARVLLFAVGLSILTGVVFGLAPAWETFRADVAGTLKEQTAGGMGSTAHVRFRTVLVMAQVALSLVLLVGAGIFARSLFNLRQIDPGFRATNLLTFAVQPSLNGYDQQRTLGLYERLSSDIGRLPQVRGVALAEIALLTGDMDMSGIRVPGYEPKEGERLSVRENFIGPRYLSTMGIPLLTGREITAQDGPNAPKVAVINQEFARKYFAGVASPVGRRFHMARTPEDDPGIEVIGVVKDSKQRDLREDSGPFVYFPYTQHPSIQRMNVYVRTAQDPAAMAAALRAQVREADPNLPVFDMKTMERQIDENVANDRMVAALSMFFGALATLLAAIGLYGVMAYTVSRRTREIGLRMALGAERRAVAGMVMREAGVVAVVGIAVALPAAYALSRLVQSQLYNVQGRDPAVFIVASVVIGMVAATAGLVPALHASRIDPMTALRNE